MIFQLPNEWRLRTVVETFEGMFCVYLYVSIFSYYAAEFPSFLRVLFGRFKQFNWKKDIWSFRNDSTYALYGTKRWDVPLTDNDEVFGASSVNNWYLLLK